MTFSSAQLRFLKAFSATGTLALCVMLSYWELYWGNRFELAIPLWLAPLLALSAGGAVTAALAGAICLIAPGRIFRVVVSGIWGLSISVWLQLSFLNRFCTYCDGTSFTDVWPLAIFSLVVWLIAPLCAMYFSRTVFRNVGKLALVLIFSQATAVLLQWLPWGGDSEDVKYREYTIAVNEKFTFASDCNVILLVVDAMGEAMFKRVYDADADLRKSLSDFTIFDRMTSTIPETRFAVPSMLSGKIYFGSREVGAEAAHSRWLQKVLKSPDSLLNKLGAAGYRREAYPYALQTVIYDPELLDNLKPVGTNWSALTLLNEHFREKICPMFFSVLIGRDNRGALRTFMTPGEEDPLNTLDRRKPFDRRFRDLLKASARKGAFAKGFKYLHLHGAHMPIVTDEALNYTLNTSVSRQLRGALGNVELLIAQLRKLGIYDRALVIVTGDHTDDYSSEVVTLIKRPGEHHDKAVFNSTPADVSEISATVLAEIGIGNPAASLFARPSVPGPSLPRRSNVGLRESQGQWRRGGDRIDFDSAVTFPGSCHLDEHHLWFNTFTSDLTVRNGTGLTLIAMAISHNCSYVIRIPGKLATTGKYSVPVRDLPDGVYVLALDAEQNGVHSQYFFDEYLTIQSGVSKLSETYVNRPLRPMRRGEQIVLSPMLIPPCLIPPAASHPENTVYRLDDKDSFGLLLPPPEGKAFSLTIPFRTSGLVNGRVICLAGGIAVGEALVSAENLSGQIHAVIPPEQYPRDGRMEISFALKGEWKGRKILISKLSLQ
ncbi:MAG: hypothetical protein PHS41_06130 [Victivallaceae bacterium]|nr:hypothetical protein [Victivallaceae bacterium]